MSLGHHFRHLEDRLSLWGPLASIILWFLGAQHVASLLMVGVGAGAMGVFFDELTSYAGRRQRISALWHIPWGVVRKGLWVFLATHLPILVGGIVMVYFS